MTIKLAIIFAPPGKRKELGHFLKKLFSDVEIHDVETKLHTKLGLNDIKEVIGSKPKNFILDEWKRVVEGIIDNIVSEPTLKSKLNIILGHSIYYNGNTREYFPLFDATFLKEIISKKAELIKTEIKITHTVLIIDDVYDLFYNLRQQTELFSQHALSTFLTLYAKSINVNYDELKNNPKAFTIWIHHCITTLLNWRAKEMVFVQNIASQLNSKFMLWGLKQDLEVLVKWIEKNEKNIIYISHPISDVREGVTKKEDWEKPLTTFINSIQMELKNNDLYSVMPTAIDEYRLENNNDHNYTSDLNLRWPVPEEVKNSLCDGTNKLVDDDYDKLKEIHPYDIVFEEGNIKLTNYSDISTIQEFVNGVFGAIDMSIEYQIGNRDHLLVWATNGIIVVEPFSTSEGKHRITGGVKMEM